MQESLDADPAGLTGVERVAGGLAQLSEVDDRHREEVSQRFDFPPLRSLCVQRNFWLCIAQPNNPFGRTGI